MADKVKEKTTDDTADKAEDKELLKTDDDKTTTDMPNDSETKPVVNKTETETKKEEKNEDDDREEEVPKPVVQEEEEEELSSSDEDDELITNTEDWDITFKLAKFLDNHFILPLFNHLKDQKQRLHKSKNTEKEKEQKSEENDDENESKKNEINKCEEISLISEKLLNLYKDDELNKIEYELLSKTCLIDEQLSIFEVLQSHKKHNKESLGEHKQRILTKLEELETVCGPLIDFLGDEKNVNELVREKSFNLTTIQSKTNMDLSQFNIDYLFAYARLRYEVGFYQHTDVLLHYYRLLTPDLSKKNAALWGQLSAQILQNKWDDAYNAIRNIREVIADNARTSNFNKDDTATIKEEEEDEWTKKARELLAAQEAAAAEKERLESINEEEKMTLSKDGRVDQTDKEKKQIAAQKAKSEKRAADSLQIASIMRDRAWLLHWSLFVYFNKDSLLDELIHLYTDAKYMNVIQTMCPHLLRYLTSAILISPNLSDKLKYLSDVSRIIIEEQYAYKDPITEFVRLVIRSNDFEGASIMLSQAMDVIKFDFFLAYYQNYFLQYARSTFLIKYCRLYNRISVKNIGKLLLMDKTMSNDQIQLWLINAIRSESIKAKLDVVENVIYVHFDETNPYQEMKDRTQSMNHRTLEIYQSIRNKFRQLQEAEAN